MQFHLALRVNARLRYTDGLASARVALGPRRAAELQSLPTGGSGSNRRHQGVSRWVMDSDWPLPLPLPKSLPYCSRS